VHPLSKWNLAVKYGFDLKGKMAEIVYISNVQIERHKGPWRTAYLPGEAKPVEFSVHGAVAKHYGVDENQLSGSHATTLDYVVAAAGG
jgi:hypothetical protein